MYDLSTVDTSWYQAEKKFKSKISMRILVAKWMTFTRNTHTHTLILKRNWTSLSLSFHYVVREHKALFYVFSTTFSYYVIEIVTPLSVCRSARENGKNKDMLADTYIGTGRKAQTNVSKVNKAHTKNHHIICQNSAIVLALFLFLSIGVRHAFVLTHAHTHTRIWYFLNSIGWVYIFYHPVYIHSQQNRYFLRVWLLLCVLFSSRFRFIHSSCFDTFEESFPMTALSDCASTTHIKFRIFFIFLFFLFIWCKQVKVL